MTTPTHFTDSRLNHLITTYHDGLLHDTLPFWINHAVDHEYGGFTFCLNRDGSLLDDDKGIWQTCRFTWLLGELYNTVEPRDEWLNLCQHGIDFINKYAFDADGRMFFQLTRDGHPLRKRRYIFTEAFGIIALAAHARATQDDIPLQKAIQLFELIIKHVTTPGLIPPKNNPDTRPSKSLAIPMILLATAQELRKATNHPVCNEWIDRTIHEIQNDFMNHDHRAVLESVTPDGELIDHIDGRILCPGHAIEAAWFILREAEYRNNDPDLIQLGTAILDWMWTFGWDTEFGGILYYRDVKNLPPQEYWHDMKFWWPQNEAIIATLYAYYLTNDPKYARWHTQIHDWAYRHFPDPVYGEWFGYLHRDGRIAQHAKGNLWKGPFHLPRMQLTCWRLAEKLANGRENA